MSRRKSKVIAPPPDAPTSIPLLPEARAIGTPEGTPVTLADGREWTLAGAAPGPDPLWDHLFDENRLAQKYQGADVLAAAHILLRANYRVSDMEAFELLRGVIPQDLVLAIEAPVFGDAGHDDRHVTWTRYVNAALRANGLDPAAIPPDELHDVLDMLVMTGRAAPESEFISSSEFVAKRHALLNFGKDEG